MYDLPAPMQVIYWQSWLFISSDSNPKLVQVSVPSIKPILYLYFTWQNLPNTLCWFLNVKTCTRFPFYTYFLNGKIYMDSSVYYAKNCNWVLLSMHSIKNTCKLSIFLIKILLNSPVQNHGWRCMFILLYNYLYCNVDIFISCMWMLLSLVLFFSVFSSLFSSLFCSF